MALAPVTDFKTLFKGVCQKKAPLLFGCLQGQGFSCFGKLSGFFQEFFLFLRRKCLGENKNGQYFLVHGLVNVGGFSKVLKEFGRCFLCPWIFFCKAFELFFQALVSYLRIGFCVFRGGGGRLHMNARIAGNFAFDVAAAGAEGGQGEGLVLFEAGEAGLETMPHATSNHLEGDLG